MSDLKFSPDLFLEVVEMDRLKKFLKDDGYFRDFMANYEQIGIVKNQYYDPTFSYFQAMAVNVADTVSVSPGFAYDSSRNVLTSTGASLLIPQRNTYYWLKINYKITNIESGTISIGGSNGGLMTGLGTAFTSLLRGQPNFPSKISFVNSVNYQQQYEVLEVVDDQTAYLQGSFPVAEVGLQWQIVGTFTPGAYPSTAQQFPFQYDDFNYSLIPETGTEVMPPYEVGVEMYIARVLSTNVGVTVEDKRQYFIAQTRAERLFSELPTITNPLIGIEAIGKTAILNNIYYTVAICWGFRVGSESRNYTINKTTINSGSGGIYATTNAFNTGDFDGWRYYYQDGSWSRIISSVKNGTGIDLQLDILKSESVGVMICPNAEEIEINMSYFIASTTGAGQLYKTIKQKFYIFTPDASLLVRQDELDTNFLEVDIQYRFKTVLNLTDWSNFQLSPYTVPGLTAIISNNIILSGNPAAPIAVTAWRGINPFCIVDTLSSPIYYKIQEQNTTVIPTVYFPNSSFPTSSVDETTVDLYAYFYSDSGLTVPLAVTHPNLRIIVKQEDTINSTQYDFPMTGDVVTTVAVQDFISVYITNPAGVNNIFLATVDSVNKVYQHPTNVVGVRRITTDNEYTFSVFPSATLIVGNTGQKGFTNLEQYFTASNLPTGTTKPNLTSDPNYIAPITDIVNCPTTPPQIQLGYSYQLNVQELHLTGSSTGLVAATAVANTQNGGYGYILPQFGLNETVIIAVQVTTLNSGNTSGSTWIRVTWQAAGATSVTFTNIQIANGVLTTLPIAFTNIQNVSLSNF